ncbi:hypothetical protein ABT278_02505 [Streptomyces sp. NPDC001228]|uniref:hypothetical protein n=1 Tax=Streptomyces sp. NPDC001228 TaxID=3154381 RepID=UPI003321426C
MDSLTFESDDLGETEEFLSHAYARMRIGSTTPAEARPAERVRLTGHRPRSRAAGDESAALPLGYIPAVTGGIEVHDLWWGLDQHLYATTSSWTCDNSADSEDAEMRLHRPSTLWRLDGDRWVAAGSRPVTVARQLDRGTTMVLTIPDCIGPTDRADAGTYCNSGILSQERHGRRTKIADGLLGLSAPPSDP